MNGSIYKRFFEVDGASYLLESIYNYSYNDLKCSVLKIGDRVNVFFESDSISSCQQDFWDLVNDDPRFFKYIDNFNVFLAAADNKCKAFLKENHPKKMISIFLDFLKMYRWTESFYTDYAYQEESGKNKLSEKLKMLEQVKTKARCFLNSFFNGTTSYLSMIASKQNNPQLFLLSSVENILDEINPTMDELKARMSNHYLGGNGIIYEEGTTKYNQAHSNMLSLQASMEYDSDVLWGTPAAGGVVQGVAYVLNANFNNYDDLDRIIGEMPNNSILVTETTSPELVRACDKALAIITNQGGLGSHAAIISRELHIPCVVGTSISTIKIKTGNILHVNGSTGEIRIIL